MQIRRMQSADLPLGLQLSTRAGWNQTLRDWQLLHALGQENSWVICQERSCLATVTSLPLSHEVAFVGMMLVASDQRRQGFGTRLLQTLIKHSHLPILRLDASAMGYPLYHKLGFRVDEEIQRFEREPRTLAMLEQTTSLRWITQTELETVTQYDWRKSRLNRDLIISNFLDRGVGVLHQRDGTATGYGCARRGRCSTHLGPVVADDESDARAILHLLVSQLSDRTLTVDVFCRHEELIKWLREIGFKPKRKFIRMSTTKGSLTYDRAMFCSFDPAMG